VKPAALSAVPREPTAPKVEDATSPDAVAEAKTLTTSASAERFERAPANLVIVTRREMLDHGWRSVADVLERLPGFYLSDDGSLLSVGVRGVTAGLNGGTRLVKVMIDGVAVDFRPEQRAFIGPEYLPVEVIERIEIVRGPLSSVWGPNALLATINVVTRTPAPGTHAVAAAGLSLLRKNRFGYGGSGAVGYADESVSLLLGVSSYSFDESGLRIQRTFPSQDPALARYAPFFAGASRKDQSDPASVFFRLILPSDFAGTLTLAGGLQRLEAGAEFRQNSVLTHQTRESLRNGWAAVRHEQRWTPFLSSRFDVDFALGGPTRDDRLYLTGTPAQTFTRNFGYRELSSRLVLEFSPRDWLSVRAGADAAVDFEDILFYTVTFAADQGNRNAGDSVDLVDANAIKTETVGRRGAFLEASLRPIPALPSLSITGTGRVDRVSYGAVAPPLAFSQRVAIVYGITPWLGTKVLYGRGFLAPSGVLLYGQSGFGISNNLIGNLTPTSGSPRLDLETVDNLEWGVGLAIAPIARADVTVFAQKVERKIEYVTVGNDYVARNNGDQSVYGGELVLAGSLGPVAPSVSGALALPKGDEVLTAYPKFMGSAGLAVTALQKPRIVAAGQVRHVSSRRATASNQTLNAARPYTLPGYESFDVSLSISGFKWLGPQSDTEFLASSKNLLDERYSEPGYGGFDLPAAGRASFFEVRQSF
jgi:iron complex outermembrane receptor protein